MLAALTAARGEIPHAPRAVAGPRRQGRRPTMARGLSLIELLVGLVLGLFVVAGASALSAGQAAHAKRLMLEAQVQQDLRAALDIVARDVRRSGYTGHAHLRVRPNEQTPAAALSEVYRAAAEVGPHELRYGYSRDRERGDDENDRLDSDESTGFRLNEATGSLQIHLGGAGWQELTDRQVVKVSRFDVRVQEQRIELPCAASGPCVGVTGCSPRTQAVRTVWLQLSGQAVHDPSVRRSLSTAVRVRNDALSCL